ncbi:MAG TPA: hypothetical protein VFV87_16565 [Pirellulaceae bacterium]|nr:hypothetical protein [Pirellulaceae bacterium]
MSRSTALFILTAFLTGGALGILIRPMSSDLGTVGSAAYGQQSAKAPPLDLAALAAEVERLKKIVPDQSHAMSDVDYHFSNLWFAGKAQNWPLADFYWKESLAHMKWAVRIIPVRKDNAGKEVKLEDILKSIENSPYMQMGEVIKQQDAAKFEPTYKYIVEGCYSCHKASDKPYLHPHIPERPASAMINFDPQADWPK